MSPIDLVSYNLDFHAAYSELNELTQAYVVDILCLQECYADDLTDTISELTIAAKTTTGKLGLAIYCSDRFTVIKSTSVAIRPSAYEQLHVQDRERLLIVELFDQINHQPFFVASFHATHFIASNYLRRQQFNDALTALNALRGEHPVILAGDFNYPFFHDKLREMAQSLDFTLTTPTNYTFSGRGFKGHFDMAATTHTDVHMQTLPFGLSDHAPILVRLNAKKIKTIT